VEHIKNIAMQDPNSSQKNGEPLYFVRQYDILNLGKEVKVKKFNCLLLTLAFILAALSLPGCGSDNLTAAPGELAAITADGEFDYDTLWQEVQEHNKKGLPKSALKVVEQIYQAAKEKSHAAEFIKALIHKIHFLQQVEEETFIKIFTLLSEEIETGRFPVTPVLHSMLAEQYWNYYQQNRYRMLKRTASAPGETKQDDIRTWDLRKIVEEVVRHYQASLKDAEKSKKIKIDIYDKILFADKSSRKYRPTLYDFLAHRAIDFFKNGESGLTQPVYRFSINKEEYFAPARDFAKLEISTRDTLSFRYYALTGLQELTRFHIDDKIPDALIDVDLKRLRFLYNEAVIDNKEKIYENVLQQMAAAFAETPAAAEVYFELAVLYNELGEKYKPRDKSAETYKWYKKKAHELCTNTIAKYPGSTGAHNCANLINRIEGRNLDLTLDRASVPGQPSRALVSYKNIAKIYFKIVKTDWKEIEAKNRLNQKKMLAFFIAKDPLHHWSATLPGDGDFQAHEAEIKLAGSAVGEYMLIGSDSKEFDFESHVVAFTFFTVSQIAYVHRRSDKKGLEFYLLHRATGKPLPNAQAQVRYREYYRPTKSYVYKDGPLLKADADGYFNITNKQGVKNYFRLEFRHGEDRLFEQREYYLHTPYNRYSQTNRTFFFTDRAIYRPGQTLYFKGIMLNVDSEAGENTHILPKRPARVTLYDVNNQKVSELNLISNEYGAYSGSFQLPQGRLNGQMRISDGYGSANFSVEEYKRPKFQVTFDAVKETYKLGDTVKVTGKATAYAGYNIDNADVKYRIVRQTFYPYRYCCRWYVPTAPKMEILNEVCKTGAKGEFEITFTALPDLTVSRELQPAFNYTVFAGVTDINGETRQASKVIPIGYTALKIGADLPEQLDKAKNRHTFALHSTNLSGDFVPAAGSITFYRLKENSRLTRKRYWATPDRHTMSQAEHYKTFPHDPFADEDDYRQWQREKKVFQGAFDTAESKELTLTGLDKWKSGKYVVEMLSQDRYGGPVKEILYFTLYSTKEMKVPYRQLDWFTVPETIVEPGENAVVLLGTSAAGVRAIYEVEHRGKITAKKYLTLSNEQKKIEIPIQEKHRGNIGIHLTFIKFNRLFKHSSTIIVPWSNKNLDVTFETFRDKLKPGEKEEWRIKIKPKAGNKGGAPGEKVMAEMVATLYDASLDAFRLHNWDFNVFPHHQSRSQWDGNNYFGASHSRRIGVLQKPSSYLQKYYDRLNWFGFHIGHGYYVDGFVTTAKKGRPMPAPPPAAAQSKSRRLATIGSGRGEKKRNGDKEKALAEVFAGAAEADDESTAEPLEKGADISTVKARANFQETAFFYPHLRTGPEGEIIIAFTVPEALTQWKMLGFTHTESGAYGLVSNRLVTQKELMVVPNAPRFLREGDTLSLTSKITNLADKELSGRVKLLLFDAATLQPVDAKFNNNSSEMPFTAKKGESDSVSWSLQIPNDLDAVTYRIVAKAGQFSDGEEKPLPILKNRMLLTETLPLPVRSLQSKNFRFEKLVNSASSTTLMHHKLTLEFTSNPVWYAVQALPYLMEYPYECMEQIFSRYYANSLASYIVNANPKIKRVFDIWKSAEGSDVLLSNLEKNQELKTILLEETPWIMNARNETERKKRIALLFDLNKMAAQSARALQKLKDGQMPSGAWPWFHGMRESRYITRHIVCGFAHLGRLGVIQPGKDKKIWAVLKEAVPYLDREINKDYRRLLKYEANLKSRHIGYNQVHYLYARSYFQDIPMDDGNREAFEYYLGQAKKYWLDFNIYMQGMIALGLNRYNDHETAMAIIKSLKEYALQSAETGMYWKSSYGYNWYQAPIETHALLIEAFAEITEDRQAVDDLKTWLLKQKQTQDWRTTKATVEACYALLLKGEDWIAESKQPEITIGKVKRITIDPQKTDNVNVEAGTGYFKTSWSGEEITPDMGYIKIKNNNKIAAWGGLYWQYFENLDKITPAKTPLQLKKELFIEKPSPTGPVLKLVKKNNLRIGDRIKVRIELRVDRTMEYVHMKDMRASGFEPENVISRFKWQDGLGYYESTKDASTNFFFDYLPKGTYVFEYPLRVSHAGDFSNGITTIQCMYAPEFASHSQGIRVRIEKK
jgi:uncharacterized protein YfaS (alpha-2-macroglobulin family)